MKIARDEINRKKDMILVLKNEKDEKEIVIKELKDQILKVNFQKISPFNNNNFKVK